MKVEQLTGMIGAIVTGFDLAERHADAELKEIERLLHEHAVLFFVDQELDEEGHRDFGSWFGDLHVHFSGHGDPRFPEIYVLEGYTREILWHADVTFEERPPRASVLRPVELPVVGGDTLWASTAAAYDNLSSAMQRLVDGLHAHHDSTRQNNRDPQLDVRHAVHPVVIDHPWTGQRCVFVNPMWTRRIVELSEPESDRVLRVLFDAVQSPTHQVRWRWQPRSVAMWDNLATQHFVTYDFTGPRVMHRVTICGPRPTSSLVAGAPEIPTT